jgi:hypothetical protein
MLTGEAYNAVDTELVAGRLRARHILHKFNNLPPPSINEGSIGSSEDEARHLLADLFNIKPEEATKLYITPPFVITL